MKKTTVEKTFHHNGKNTHFANYLNSTQVTKVQNKKKKSVASLLRTAEKKKFNDEVSQNSAQIETIINLWGNNSSKAQRKCLRAFLKRKGSFFSAAIDTGIPASFVIKLGTYLLVPKDPNAIILS